MNIKTVLIEDINAYNYALDIIFISRRLIRRNLVAAYSAFLHELGHALVYKLDMSGVIKKDIDLFWDKDIISDNYKTDEALAWTFSLLVYDSLKLKFGKSLLKHYARKSLKAYKLKDIQI